MSGHYGHTISAVHTRLPILSDRVPVWAPSRMRNKDRMHFPATQGRVKVGLWNSHNACKPLVFVHSLASWEEADLRESCSPCACQTSCCLPASFPEMLDIHTLDSSMDTASSTAISAGRLNDRTCLMTWAAQVRDLHNRTKQLDPPLQNAGILTHLSKYSCRRGHRGHQQASGH